MRGSRPRAKVQRQLFANAVVTQRGAVLLGDSVACDAFDESRPLRVVTHAHADHLRGLRRSLKTCEKVLMTKPTRDLIKVLEGPDALSGVTVKTLEYGKPFKYGDEKITLAGKDILHRGKTVRYHGSSGDAISSRHAPKVEGFLDMLLIAHPAGYS